MHISNWTHKFQNRSGLDAKTNSELYKSNRVCSVYYDESLKSYLHSLAQQPEKKYVSAGNRLRAVVAGEYFTTVPPMPLSIVSHEAIDGWKHSVSEKTANQKNCSAKSDRHSQVGKFNFYIIELSTPLTLV